MISVREEKYQTFYKNKPLNFSIEKQLPKTQDLEHLTICSWNICIWNRHAFLKHFNKYGYAVFVKKIDFYKIDPIKSLKISNEEDFN